MRIFILLAPCLLQEYGNMINREPVKGRRTEPANSNSRTGDRTTRQESDIATLAIRRIVSNGWESRLNVDRNTKSIITGHVLRMRDILGSFAYEISGVHNLINNSQNLSHADLQHYTKRLEAIAFGYKEILGSRLTSTIVSGITSDAKDTTTVSKQCDYMLDLLARRMKTSESKAKKFEERTESMLLRLRYMESGIFRFLKRGKIHTMRRKISRRMEYRSVIAEPAARYRSTIDNIGKILKN
jgi:hypothetical protein